MRFMKSVCVLALVSAVSTASPVWASAFYAGKSVTIVTSMGAGGTYDITARLIARTIPRYLAGGPGVIVKNMPGAGNVLATNYMYNIAPKDGTVIAVVNNAIPLNQLLGGKGVRYDASKFNWLGSPVRGSNAIIVMASTGVKSMQDLFEREVVMGGIGAGSSNVIWPTVLNNVLGTKFKIVPGYKSGPALWLAMERGETEGRTGSFDDLQSEHPEWVTEHKVMFPVQLGASADKALPSVPLIASFAKTDEQRRILELVFSPISLGQPYLAPPAVPKERLALLRAAFAQTLRDKSFLEDAHARKIDIDPIGAGELSGYVQAGFHQPKEIVEKATAAMRLSP